jgi:hypothetical protein
MSADPETVPLPGVLVGPDGCPLDRCRAIAPPPDGPGFRIEPYHAAPAGSPDEGQPTRHRIPYAAIVAPCGGRRGVLYLLSWRRRPDAAAVPLDGRFLAVELG